MKTKSLKKQRSLALGLFGLEVAENLHKKGLEVTIVEKAPHVLPPLDEEMAAYVKNELIKQGVNVFDLAVSDRF